MIDFLVIHHPHDHSLTATVWTTGAVWSAVLVALGVMGYLVWARKPEADPLIGVTFAGLVAACVWPVLLTGATLYGLTFGLRQVVQHGRDTHPRISKDERIRRLQEANDRLRAQIDREPDGIDIVLAAEGS